MPNVALRRKKDVIASWYTTCSRTRIIESTHFRGKMSKWLQSTRSKMEHHIIEATEDCVCAYTNDKFEVRNYCFFQQNDQPSNQPSTMDEG